MLYEVLLHIHNFFPDTEKQIVGEFTIIDGTISPLPQLASGQYYLIEGSAVNDGVWSTSDILTDESFDGAVTPLRIPKALLDIVSEIETAESKNTASPFTSESFGGYSYTRATNASGSLKSNIDAYESRLKAWRKL